MSEDKVRAEFEAWWKATMNTEAMDLHRCEFPMTRPENQPYACHETNRAWAAWQASRAALVVELPARWNDDDGKFYKDRAGPHMDSKEVIEAIEAAGVRVKT